MHCALCASPADSRRQFASLLVWRIEENVPETGREKPKTTRLNNINNLCGRPAQYAPAPASSPLTF